MTVAAMADTRHETRPLPARGIGVLAIATGIATLALLADHPGGAAQDFAGVLREEAANRGTDALVHGGFIAVLALQAVCYAAFCARLGWQRIATVAGFTFFCIGAAFLGASMLLDGLVTPAVAARYMNAPDRIEYARALFVLIGTLISFLMPIGLAFQSTAIAAWGLSLTASGKRLAGTLGLLLGAVALAAAVAGFANPMAVVGAIVATSVWAMGAGWILARA